MFDLWNPFNRKARRRAPPTAPITVAPAGALPSTPGGGLEIEYQAVIEAALRRMGIASDGISVEVRRFGFSPSGFEVMAGMMRLHRWERDTALRVLIGLPLLEARVRRSVRSTWLADYSHFGGLWLHASEQLHTEAGASELRDLVRSLTGRRGRRPRSEGR